MFIFGLLPLTVTLGGFFMLMRLDFFFLLHPRRTLVRLFSTLADSDRRRSLILALAGTLGVGNIVGVAVGISVGGAGSVFWLLLSSVFAAALKYSEVTLAQDASSGVGGGMIRAVQRLFSVGLSRVYAVLCLLLALVMGCALQTESAVLSLKESLGISPFLSVALFLLAFFLAIRSGAERVDRVAAVIIPTAMLVYVFLALALLLQNPLKIPEAVLSVFSDAFTPDAGVGGLVGFLTSKKIREGYSRGLLSNEAGAGTSSLAHTRSAGEPCEAGLHGICEVIFDTVILCTLTALAILVALPEGYSECSGVTLVMLTVGSVFGNASQALLAILIGAFALSTVICWYYYGYVTYSTLFGRVGALYSAVFVLFLALGSHLPERMLVLSSDVLLLGLTLISTLTVIKGSDRIRLLSEQGGLIRKRNSE